MNFWFCETCGKRLTQGDLDAGAGRDKKLKGVYCTSCSVGIDTMKMAPIADSELAKHAPAPNSPLYQGREKESRTTYVGNNTRTSDHSMRPAGAVKVPVSRIPRQNTAPKSRKTMPVVGGVAFAAALVLGIAFASPGRNPLAVRVYTPSEPHESPTIATAPEPPPIPAPTPENDKVAETKSAPQMPESGVAKAGVPNPSEPLKTPDTPPAPVTPPDVKKTAVTKIPTQTIGSVEPTAGAPKPADSPKTPAANTAPAAGDSGRDAEGWKNLFNEKDLSGWTVVKGDCAVEAGLIVLKATSKGGQHGARIDGAATFANAELTCKVYVEGYGLGEIRVRDTCIVSIKFAAPGWKDIRVAMHGNKVEATVDGLPTPQQIGFELPIRPSGPIKFFINRNGTMKIKDARIRILPE